jgi:predicted nucleic acid-binding protein
MSDVILLDANVLDQINRGNAAAANALLTRIRNGDQVYISQQAYNEAIVNTLPRQATANRLLLERLNINLAPAGDATIRYDTYAGNATPRVQVLSEADARVAAQARAIGAQVWSFDGAFRNNGNAVTQQLGVRVAAE